MAMPKGGTLINTSRVEVLHEGDLLEVLKERAELLEEHAYPIFNNISDDDPITHHSRHPHDDIPVTSVATFDENGLPQWKPIPDPLWEDHRVTELLSTEEKQNEHLRALGAIACKVYVGFDLETGSAFFYAAISKVNLRMLIAAVIDKKAGIQGNTPTKNSTPRQKLSQYFLG